MFNSEAYNRCIKHNGQLPVPKSKEEVLTLKKKLDHRWSPGSNGRAQIHLGITKYSPSSWIGKITFELINNLLFSFI